MYVNCQALARTVAQMGKNRPRTPNARRAHARQWSQECALPSIQTKPASRGPATSTSDDAPLAIPPRKAGAAGGGRRLMARIRGPPIRVRPSRAAPQRAASPGGDKVPAAPQARSGQAAPGVGSRRERNPHSGRARQPPDAGSRRRRGVFSFRPAKTPKGPDVGRAARV